MLTRLLALVLRSLHRPTLAREVMALTALLCLPSLFAGFAGDDHFHRVVLQGALEPWIPSHRIFAFFPADPEARRELVARGLAPWWGGASLSVDFFRPLTVWTHWLDMRLWPSLAWPAHAQNIAAYLLFVWLAGALYRRVEGGALAAFALLIFALDDNHAIAVGWIANRNAILAGVWTALALILHDRWRRDGWTPGALAGPLAYAAALASAEAGVGAAGYLASYALFLDRRRLWTLAPYAAVTALWQLLYRLGDYGVRGSGAYNDPGSDPLGFAAGALVNVPVLLFAQLALLPADALAAAPGLLPVGAAVCALSLLFAARLAWPALEKTPALGFWAVGAVLGLVPFGAAFPQDRHLLLVGLGAAPVVARVLMSPGVQRRLVGALVLFQLLLPPLLFVPRSFMFTAIGRLLDGVADDLPAEGHAVLLNAPVDLFPIFLSYSRMGRGLEGPELYHFLYAGLRPLRARAVDAHTLELEPEGGWFREVGERFLREEPLSPGEVLRFRGLEVRVGPMGETGQPALVWFRFDDPLAEIQLYRWVGAGLERVASPAPGELVVVPGFMP